MLRGKLLNKIKPKSLFGKEINGNMLTDLAEKYVLAFNSGKVPNLQDSWTYLCQRGCLEAMRKAEDYLFILLEEIEPFPFEDLAMFETLLKDAKLKSKILFDKESKNLDKGSSLEDLETALESILRAKSD